MSNAPEDRGGFDARLEELEREVKRMADRLAALEAGAASRSGEGAIDELRVKRLSVVDSEDMVRIRADAHPDGTAGVKWFDRDGKVRIVARTDRHGLAAVEWFDPPYEEPRIAAGTDAGGSAALLLRDRDGNPRIQAATLADGRVVLPTRDLEEKP